MVRLAKKCKSCWEFFEVDRTLTFEFYCDKKKCQKRKEKRLKKIKKARHIPMNFFDIYDLDRPIYWEREDEIKDYERVCRICGQPIRNKDGTYSRYRKYCNSKYCSGNSLFKLLNCSAVTKLYAEEVRRKNIKEINKKVKKLGIEEDGPFSRIKYYFTQCELCGSLCFLWRVYSGAIRKYDLLHIHTVNIHHKIPVHTLTWDNIHLIWDKRNLIALCEDCHHKQDHKLSKPKVDDPNIKFKEITEFMS
jgi:hypothetical protein